MTELKQRIQTYGRSARIAAKALALLPTDQKNSLLNTLAARIREQRGAIQAANQKDLEAGKAADLSDALLDRLLLDEKRIEAAARGIEEIIELPDPVGTLISESNPVSDLTVKKVRCPIGVIAIIYESRPNVTIDTAALCLKSGNAVILRGGKEAFHSNQILADCVAYALEEHQLPASAVQLVDTTDREAVKHLVTAEGLIDVVIPRGGEGLIQAVSRQATIPVLKHYKGVCHVYIDRDCNPDWAKSIAVNAKCQRPGVCNAAETILVHEDLLSDLLPSLCQQLADEGVEIRGDDRTQSVYQKALPASEEDWSTEYLDQIVSIRVVASVEEAIDHINHFGSHHSEAIISNDENAIDAFSKQVDSAAIHVNASTRFTDGGMFGLGAEMGISTDKLHARGPMGLEELTTYKWITEGKGTVRV